MSKITILKGLPASGKSTWAKEQVAKSNGKIKRVNKDDLREMLDCSIWSRENEDFILTARDEIIREAVKDGYDVIVDDTNLAEKHEMAIKEIAKEFDIEPEIKFFNCDVRECIRRDSMRVKPVGAKVIGDMYEKYLKPKPKEVIHDTKLPACIICDIDGTLAHMDGRTAYEWDKVQTDKLDIAVASILWEYHRSGFKILIVSGRDEACKGITKEWLNRNAVYYSEIYMRPEGNNEDDRIIKQRIYDEKIKGKYNVLFVLDDRNKVVDMWRENGLKCLQVAEGNF